MIDFEAMLLELDRKIEEVYMTGEYPKFGFVTVKVELASEDLRKEWAEKRYALTGGEGGGFTPKGRRFTTSWSAAFEEDPETGAVESYIYLPEHPQPHEIDGFWFFLYLDDMQGRRRHGYETCTFREWIEIVLAEHFKVYAPGYHKEIRAIYDKLMKSKNERE